MTRNGLIAAAAMCGLVLATGVFAAQGAQGDGSEGDGYGRDHGRGPMAFEGPEAVADHLMAHFDLNKDGKITRDEILRSLKQETDAHFTALDTNHDGVVTPDELLQAHVVHMKEHVDAMFKKLDKNGDGKLTPDELAAAGPMMMAMHRRGEWMNHHDHDGMDGHDGMNGDTPGRGGTQP